MSVSVDLIKLLVSKGLGTLGQNIGTEFSSVSDDYLVVRAYGGEAPESAKGTGPLLRRPRVQISCRSKSLRAAEERAELAYKHLAGFHGVIEGKGYTIRALGEPFPLGRDEDGRERVVCSYEILK